MRCQCLCMHANVCVLLRPRMLGGADLPTTGLDWLLQRDMPLLVAFLDVALALLATVYELREVVCFGTQAMRVRCHFPKSRMSAPKPKF